MNNSSECAGVAACHGAELVFEWDNAAAYNISFTPDETSLAQAFAVVLRQLAAQGSIPWPRFDPDSRAFMQVQVSHSLPQPSDDRCSYAVHRRRRLSPPRTKASRSALCGLQLPRDSPPAPCCSSYSARPMFDAAVRSRFSSQPVHFADVHVSARASVALAEHEKRQRAIRPPVN